MAFPGGSDSKDSTCSTGDQGSIPGSGRSPGEGNDNPLQCSCLENPMDRGAWWATVKTDTHTHFPNVNLSLASIKEHSDHFLFVTVLITADVNGLP